ncbi:MAG TPA: hypothetical protein VNA13_02565 [Xanthomonadales bacterium]|nr:hypothetical protein [Xanthomonadales bacterium]
MGRGERSPEVRGNRDRQQGREAGKDVVTQNPMEAFLAGHGHGTPRFKAAADMVALRVAQTSRPERGRISSETVTKKLIRVGVIEGRIEGRKSEKDGLDYEEAIEEFKTEVEEIYREEEREGLSSVDLMLGLAPRVATRMKEDWDTATAIKKPDARTVSEESNRQLEVDGDIYL